MSCRPTQSLAQFVSIMSVACCQVCPNEEKFWAYRTYHLKISIIEVLVIDYFGGKYLLKRETGSKYELGSVAGSTAG